MEDFSDITEKWKMLMGEFAEVWKEAWETLGLAGTCACIAGIAFFIMEVVYGHKHAGENRKTKLDKKIETAKQLGHVHEAKRAGYSIDNDESGGECRYYGTYVYDVNGKTYRYTTHGWDFPPPTLEVYYLDNPGKGFSSLNYSYTIMETLEGLLLYILPIIVGAIVYNLINLIV